MQSTTPKSASLRASSLAAGVICSKSPVLGHGERWRCQSLIPAEDLFEKKLKETPLMTAAHRVVVSLPFQHPCPGPIQRNWVQREDASHCSDTIVTHCS